MAASHEQLVTALRTSLKETERLRRQNQQLLAMNGEPIAIVGMSCRYPGGVGSPEDLWELVVAGRDAISPFPRDRGWSLEGLYDPDPDHPATSYVSEGGFLEDIAQFDAAFFGISPREALAMDPQQRLLLEVSWETLESAGIDPALLRGSETGVFAGICMQEYGPKLLGTAVPHELEGYLSTGTSLSVGSGRVSYALGLEGPTMTVDTACSSSLVSMHLACAALHAGECSLALAGGVTVLASPIEFVEFSRQRVLARDGRCKSFAASADGTGFSEGVGMVLLERLSDAHRLGHDVLAVVRGSAINHDGASNGLTAPSGPAQRRVISQALTSAGLKAKDIDAVEAHGTGTTLGDQIEAQALLATYGQDRPTGRPLYLGSLKSNIGHAQAAAGVAGVIKMVMAMRNGALPKTLYAQEPSPAIDWAAGEISLLADSRAWTEADGEQERPRRAAVSSFGISGTNAHLILERPPLAPGSASDSSDGAPTVLQIGAAPSPPAEEGSATPTLAASEADWPVPWALSGATAQALRAQAARLHVYAAGTSEPDLLDVGLSLTARPRFAHRAVLRGKGREELLEGLRALADGERSSALIEGAGVDAAGRGAVFVFPGQGAQWQGMGVELLDSSPVFKQRMDACAEALEPHLEWSLEEVLRGAHDAPSLDRIDVVQPALFAMMISLAELWRAWGVEPEVVVGHSQGEVAAACVAGALSLEDAARVVALRSRLLANTLVGRGAIVSVALALDELRPRLERWGDRLTVSAVNGPSSVGVAGDPQALEELLAELEREDVRARMVPATVATHSPQAELVREELLEVLSSISPRSSATQFHSTVTGEVLDTVELDGQYWYRNMREPVQFEPVVRSLLAQGHRAFVEISPHPVLGMGMWETADEVLRGDAQEGDRSGVLIGGSLRRAQGGLACFVESLAQAWVHGVEVAWGRCYEGTRARRVKLPTYAFQRERYWLEGAPGVADLGAAGQAVANHPLLGAVVGLAGADGWLFTGQISLESHPWLCDHMAMGVVLLPGTAFVELALRAGREAGCELLSELVLEAPLVLSEDSVVQLQVSVSEPDDGGRRTVQIHSRTPEEVGEGLEQPEPWTRHAGGVLSPASSGDDAPGFVRSNGMRRSGEAERSLAQLELSLAGVWPPAGAEAIALEDHYERLAEAGLEYGPAFQGLEAAWRRGDELFVEVSLREQTESGTDAFGLHPALLDAALHAVGLGLLGGEQGAREEEIGLPFSWSSVELHHGGASSLRVRLAREGPDGISLLASDEAGSPVASIGSLTLRALPAELARGRASRQGSLLAMRWMDIGSPPPSAASWVVLGDAERVSSAGSDDAPVSGSDDAPVSGSDDAPVSGSDDAPVSGSDDAPACYRDLDELGRAIDDGLAVPDTVLLRVPEGIPTNSEGMASELDVGDAGAEMVTAVPERAHEGVFGVLGVVRRWLGDVRFGESCLVVVTRGGVVVDGDGDGSDGGDGLGVVDLGSGGVWGLVRSAQSEHPGRLMLVDCDGASELSVVGGLVRLGESQVAVRGGVVLVPRLVRVERSPVGVEGAGVVEAPGDRGWLDGVVLVTGGTGGLGGLVARHLVVEQGVDDLVLVGRRGLGAPGAVELEEELVGLGARVRVVACDVSDREQVRGLIESIAREGVLCGVVHAAGVLDDGVVESLTEERVGGVLAPKVNGAWYLHELTEGLDLRMFVLFSSAAGVLGSPGQGSYAAGNAFLDALASFRRARGLVGVSIAWGLWEQEDSGSALTAGLGEGEQARIARSGVLALSAEEGLGFFDEALSVGEALVLAARFDGGALRAQARAGLLPGVLRGLVRTPARRGGDGSLAARLEGAGEGERERIALDVVRGEVALVLGYGSPDAVDSRRSFKELGFDSLTAIELRNRLGGATGLRLPATLVFDYPTPHALAEFLLASVGDASSGSGIAAVSSHLARGLEDPVAIVGMSCRYPGDVSSPEDLWEMVASGGEGISMFPADRGWDVEGLYDPDPESSGKSYVREGGFLYDAGEFDAAFFGISPREALAMDPQQRLLLEASWEAMEDAGIDPASLHGSATGVFAGVMYHDYVIGMRTGAAPGVIPSGVEGYLGTGSAGSVASGRVSYSFGFEGPAVTVDTACSSSLVALHLAAQALRSGECSLALAGGATVLVTPALFVEFSRQRGLARDGRCKSFAQAADGTGFSEGVGMVLLERLSDARRLGHNVLGVVRGSAVNQDGASNGLTSPNGPSQQRVIRQALANAGLSTQDVDVVEAHGTGTTLGDPIEAQALLATYGNGDRPSDRPLRLGSIKSNIGHAQAAAGIAGVIKMVMAMNHGVLPKTLHIDEPSTHVDWSAGAITLLTHQQPWHPNNAQPRRAGISSFGISGTNAHLILEEAPTTANHDQPAAHDRPTPPASTPIVIDVHEDGTREGDSEQGQDTGQVADRHVVPWLISGRNSGGLKGQAARLLEFLDANPELDEAHVAAALATRPTLEHRAILIGQDKHSLRDALQTLAQGESLVDTGERRDARGIGASTVASVADIERESVVFMFSGQGGQWPGMAVELLERSPVFARELSSCDKALQPLVDWSLEGVLRGAPDAPGLERVDVVQPVLFATMVALAGLWRACGVEPDAVMGHSQGEIAAAHVAGGLSLEDATRVVVVRSRALTRIMGRGGTVSVALSREELEPWLERTEGAVSLAAVNGPRSSVVSGAREALDGLLEEWAAADVRAREVDMGYAAHSTQMDELRAEMLAGCAGITPVCGEVPFLSTVTGEFTDTAELDEDYWYRNLRETVRFEPAMRRLLTEGHRAFVEIGPHPVLTVGAVETIDDALESGSDTAAAAVVGSLRRGDGGLRRFLISLGEAWVRGVAVDWRAVLYGFEGERVKLPRYAFQREHYWFQPDGADVGDVAAIGQVPSDHPLLGSMVGLAGAAGGVLTGSVSLESHPWLADHAAMGMVLLPGTAFLEMALYAGGKVGCEVVRELVLEAPLVLPERGLVQLQVVLGAPEDPDARTIAIYSRPQEREGDEDAWVAQEWTRHASGTLLAATDSPEMAREGAEGLSGSWPPPGAGQVELDGLYDRLAEWGLEYGSAFQRLTGVWRRGEEVFAEVSLSGQEGPGESGFVVHPALLDSALHAIAVGLSQAGKSGQVRLPFSWEQISVDVAGVESLRVRLVVEESGRVSVLAADEAGRPIASVGSLALRPVSLEQLADGRGARREHLLRQDWVPVQQLPAAVPAGEEWTVLGRADEGLSAGLSGIGVYARAYATLDALGAAVDEADRAPELVFLDCLGEEVAAGVSGGDGPAGMPGGVSGVVCGVLGVVQGWLADERFASSCLAVVTRGGVCVGGESVAELDLGSGAVWGLVRSAQSEHPGRFVLVDSDDVSLGALPGVLGLGEPQVALRDGGVLAARLARVEPVIGVASGVGVDSACVDGVGDGVVLVTGGTGGLGGLVARHLVVEHGVDDLVLVSRQGGAAPGAAELEEELVALGARVEIVACDVSDREQLRVLIESITRERVLRGVVHAAAALDDGLVQSLTVERVEEVLAPKADGAWYLHELTEHLDLGMFVLFSSVAGVLGAPGQGSYAAGNAFLDALASFRRARGLAGVSIAWGMWEQEASGSALTAGLSEGERARIARSGVLALSVDEGLGCFDAAMSVGDALVIALRLDGGALRAQARAGLLPAVLRGLVRVPARRAGNGSLAARLVGEGERERVVLELVRGEVASVLGHSSPEVVDPRLSFKELGFDSLTAIELRNRLGAVTALRLPATLVFDYPTPQALAEFMLQSVGDERSSGAVAVSSHVVRDLDDPVAIVGMSCRYPGGVSSPEDLWEMVASGGEGISMFPADRGWDVEGLYDPDPESSGKSYVREGGFLYDAGEFDAAFFGISPREALAMDPQQRLLLEASWEAMEDAGIDPASLHGSATGVFAGVMYHDYVAGLRSGGPGEVPSGVEGYLGTGSAGSVASGRVAYSFGFEGPAVTVDTACSSSLVALHLACQAVRSGECSLALAGGVTVLVSPALFVEFSRQRGLARDGRCKAFADGADGTGFSEGVGMVLVERLSDAQRLGHRVLGVVRGSAVNQDGASNGLTSPNGPSQQRVIRQALANAGLSVSDVDAVEAHGTGTTLGDPIEAQALLATYGSDRPPERRLRLGSIKSNIGHSQAAAGVAGVIKMVMAMRHGILPKTLHIDAPSTHVDWSAGAISLLTEQEPWLPNGQPRRAGISSFGISGTNAHLILEEAPPTPTPTPNAPTARVPAIEIVDGAGSAEGETGEQGGVADGRLVPWLLSARNAEGLRGQAGRLLQFVDADPGLDVGGVSAALATRPMLEHRAIVLGQTKQGLRDGLMTLEGAVPRTGAAGECKGAVECTDELKRTGALERADGGQAERVIQGVAGAGRDGVVFMFSGQGGQWPGMAVELLERSPVFAHELKLCEEALGALVDWSLQDVLRETPGAPGLERVDVVQPVLFATMVALARLWLACGVHPNAVVGHSQGEIAAAHIAGGLSLEDATRVVVVRSRALTSIMGRGGMASVALSAHELEPWLERTDGAVSLAAVNGPHSSVISGERDALDCLLGELPAAGIRAREIPVGYASHSGQIEEIREELLEGCVGIAPITGKTPFLSTVTGEPIDTAELDGEYWYRNLRETVAFQQATRWLLREGCRVFVEVGPHPVLTIGVQETIEEVLPDVEDAVVVGSLRRQEGGMGRFLTALGEVWVKGVEVDWGAVVGGSESEHVRLPRYAFQRERYWLQSYGGVGDVAAIGQVAADHPLLGSMVGLAGEAGALLTGSVSLERHPWLADHAAMGAVLLPGTAFLEMALYAGGQIGCEIVRELVLEAPLVLPEQGAVQLQVAIGPPGESGARTIAIHSRPEGRGDGDGWVSEEWTRHASGVLADEPAARKDSQVSELFSVWPPGDARSVDLDESYGRLAEWGLEYGPAFQGLTAAWVRGEEVFAEVSLGAAELARGDGYVVHPALLDSALHAIAGLPLAGAAGATPTHLPFSWSEVGLDVIGIDRLRVRMALQASGEVALSAVDEAGEPVLSVGSLALRPVSAEQLAGARAQRREHLLRQDWVQTQLAPYARDGGDWALLGSENGELAGALAQADIPTRAYRDLDGLVRALVEGARAPELVILDCLDAEAVGGENGAKPFAAATTTATGAMPERVRETVQRALSRIQAWLGDERFDSSCLAIVTRGAIGEGVADDIAGLEQAAVWGLVRSAQSENPGRIVLVDVDQASWARLPEALASEQPQVALRAGAVRTPRLVRAEQAAPPPPIDPQGTVLITGGTGALGGLVARHLASEHRSEHLLLTSRQGSAAAGAPELVAELRELGAQVTIAACDVGEREQLRALFESIPADRPLRAVVHAAGALDDGVIGSLTAAQIDRVFKPKVDGAWFLHELTRSLDLSDFILFSSAAGIFGGPGQGGYAAANAFLDRLAEHRRMQGLPASSIAWGQWAQTGEMAGSLSETDLRRIARTGVTALSAAEGLSLFDAARRAPDALTVALGLDLAALRAFVRSGLAPALLAGLVQGSSGRRRGGTRQDSLQRRLVGVAEGERESIALELVRAETAAVLGYASTEAVDTRLAFLELGFDSLTALELRNRLSAAAGMQLPATLVFDYPNPAALAEYLLGQASAHGIDAESASPAGVDAPGEGASTATLTAMFRHAHEAGQTEEFMVTLTTMSRFRPTFAAAPDSDRASHAMRLAAGASSPSLICLPSVIATSGPHQYAKFAAAFRDEREVLALALPGYLAGEQLPADAEVAIATLAQAVRRAAAEAPFVLLGHSTGGTLAQAVAARLETEEAQPPQAVVLIDTYRFHDLSLPAVRPVLSSMLSPSEDRQTINDARLTAMAAYLTFIADCAPTELACPTLLVRASEPLVEGLSEEEWRTSWDLPHTVLDARGDHLSMMERHAGTTARVVQDWLSSARPASGRTAMASSAEV